VQTAVCQLTAFVETFPELEKLSLACWVIPATPIELSKLSSSDLRTCAPAYSALLDFLLRTKVNELQVDWRSPLSEFWGWTVRLHRVGDVFKGEAFDSEGKQNRSRHLRLSAEPFAHLWPSQE